MTQVQRARFQLRARCVAGIAALLLAGCGGGGGSSGSPASPTAGQSLIPPAPAVGAVLYETASLLRPLRPGARWVYRTEDRAFGQFTQTSIQHAAAADGSVTESDSSSPETSQLTVDPASGTVNFSVALELVPKWVPVVIAGPELRSPIRQNDQYNLIEERFSNQPIDIDGDGKFDTVDVASYRRVIGNESVTLPNRTLPVLALRVDTVLTVRINPSNRTTPLVTSSSVSTWYAPGIGVVRQLLASSDPSRSFDQEDLLLGWDGLTEGWGFVMQPAQTQRTAGGGTAWVEAPSGAVVVPDGALITSGSRVHRLDSRGMVQASQDPPSGQFQALMRLSAGNRWLSGSWPSYQLHALSDAGATLGSGPVGVFTLASTDPATLAEYAVGLDGHPTSDQFWMAWQRTVASPSTGTANQLVVRAIGADGSTPRPEIVIPIGSPLTSSSTRLAAHANGALVTWIETTASSGNTIHYAGVSATGQIDFQRSIAVSSPAVVEGLRPLVGGDLRWLVWRGPTLSGTDPVAHAVRMDALGNLVGTAPDEAGLRAAVVGPYSTEASAAWPTAFTAADGSLFGAAAGYGLALPDERYPAPYVEYSVLNVPGATPSASLPQVSRLRVAGSINPAAASALVFADRVLLLTTGPTGLFQPTVIWR